MLLLDAISLQQPAPDPKGLVLGLMAGATAAGLAAGRKRLDQPTLVYLLVPVPLFLLVTWLAVWLFDRNGTRTDAFDFLALQVMALLAGIVHVRLFYQGMAGWRPLHWPVHGRDWSWRHFGFAALLVLMGCIGVMGADVLTGAVQRGWGYFPALFTFLVPILWVKALDMYTGIPVAEYRPWYPTMDFFTYEPHPKFPKASIRIVLEDGNEGDLPDVPFDRNMPFENVYRWALHTHLQNEPGIYYMEEGQSTLVWGWHFHRQRTSWIRWNRRIDPARTFKENRLRQGDIIIALRAPRPERLEVVRAQVAGKGKDLDA